MKERSSTNSYPKPLKKCYHCGSTSNITRDHIPPIGFFVPPLPTDLITVPCCKECNESFSKDDEAARLFFSVYRWVSDRGKWIYRNKSLDSTLWRSPGLKKELLESIIHLPVQTDRVIEIVPAVTFPKDRLNRFLIRITKGLLCKFFPKIEYTKMYFKVEQLDASQKNADFMYEHMNSDMRGDGIFRFWYLILENDPCQIGIWTHVFYDGLCFEVIHSNNIDDLSHGD